MNTLLEMNYGIRPLLKGDPPRYELMIENRRIIVGFSDLAPFIETVQPPFVLEWGTIPITIQNKDQARRWASWLRGATPPGLYLHKSGRRYRVTGCALDCTNARAGTPVVKYFSDAAHGSLIRDAAEFREMIIWPDDIFRPRFILLPEE